MPAWLAEDVRIQACRVSETVQVCRLFGGVEVAQGYPRARAGHARRTVSALMQVGGWFSTPGNLASLPPLGDAMLVVPLRLLLVPALPLGPVALPLGLKWGSAASARSARICASPRGCRSEERVQGPPGSWRH